MIYRNNEYFRKRVVEQDEEIKKLKDLIVKSHTEYWKNAKRFIGKYWWVAAALALHITASSELSKVMGPIAWLIPAVLIVMWCVYHVYSCIVAEEHRLPAAAQALLIGLLVGVMLLSLPGLALIDITSSNARHQAMQHYHYKQGDKGACQRLNTLKGRHLFKCGTTIYSAKIIERVLHEESKNWYWPVSAMLKSEKLERQEFQDAKE